MSKKPYSYYIGLSCLIIWLLGLAITFVISVLGFRQGVASDTSGGWLLAMPLLGPMIVFYLVQIGIMLALFYWLVRKMGEWLKPALIVWGCIGPFAVMLVVGQVMAGSSYQFRVSDPTPFYLIAALFLIIPVIVYYDIKYRSVEANRGHNQGKP